MALDILDTAAAAAAAATAAAAAADDDDADADANDDGSHTPARTQIYTPTHKRNAEAESPRLVRLPCALVRRFCVGLCWRIGGSQAVFCAWEFAIVYEANGGWLGIYTRASAGYETRVRMILLLH